MHSKPKMIIAQPYLNLMGGAERVILQIAKHYDAKIYTMEYSKDTTFPEFQNIDIRMRTWHSPTSCRTGLRRASATVITSTT